MKFDEWKAYITEATRNVGTYRPEFDKIIETLAAMLEKRDDINEEYTSLPEPVIHYPNGTVGKNPLLLLWDGLNKSALAYWRDLGLTPAGLKKLNESAIKPQEDKGLAAILREYDEVL